MTPTDATTWYRIDLNSGVTVHTRDAATADAESRAGARVTATTVGAQA